MKVKLFGCFLVLFPMLFANNLAHFTPPNSIFQTEVVLRNVSQNPATVWLILYTPNQESPVETAYDITGGETLVLSGSDLPIWPTHLSMNTNRLVHASLRYRCTQGGNSVSSNAIVEPARAYLFNYPNPKDFWVGLAVVNNGKEPLDLLLGQFNEEGDLLKEMELTTSPIEASNKHVSLLSSLALASEPNTYVEISGDQPFSAMMLFGNKEASKPFIGQVLPETVFTDRIVASQDGGIGGFLKKVTIEKGVLTYQVTSVSTRTIEIPQNAYRALTNELLNLEVATLLVSTGPLDCCDQFNYHLEFVDGSQRNDFSFNSFDLDADLTGTQEAAAIIQYVFEYAESLFAPSSKSCN